MSGDLSQRIGAPVERGELLFEIAPLDDYRVVLQVDERDIADVSEGQKGEVVFASLPDGAFRRRRRQDHAGRAGRRTASNFFRVEAQLTEASPRLRPGMEGVAKIAVDERRWSGSGRALVDWLRLASWRWMP